MSETRDLETIQNQYQGLCLKLGHLEYQVYVFNKDIEMIKSTLRDINLEASAAKAKADEAAKTKESENA